MVDAGPTDRTGPGSPRRRAWVSWISLAAVAAVLFPVLLMTALGSYTAGLPRGPTYQVTFSETGLQNGSTWSVSLGRTTEHSGSASIHFAVPNGTYAFIANTGAPNSTATPASGSVHVSGAPSNVSVAFGRPSQQQFSVTFSQNTLPPNTPWSVSIGWEYTLEWGSENVFDFPDGFYRFVVTPVPGYIPTPANGSVTIQGRNLSVQIVFSPAPEYPLTFYETGLPPGSVWYVTLDYTSSPSNSTSHTFWVSNGTHPYFIGPAYVSGALWDATPENGTVVINGAGASVSASFSVSAFMASFNTVGLPSGTWWTLNITVDGNSSQSGGTTGSSEVFFLPNGTYGFSIGPVPGYSASPDEGNFTINGAPVNITITFTAAAGSDPSTPGANGVVLSAIEQAVMPLSKEE